MGNCIVQLGDNYSTASEGGDVSKIYKKAISHGISWKYQYI